MGLRLVKFEWTSGLENHVSFQKTQVPIFNVCTETKYFSDMETGLVLKIRNVGGLNQTTIMMHACMHRNKSKSLQVLAFIKSISKSISYFSCVECVLKILVSSVSHVTEIPRHTLSSKCDSLFLFLNIAVGDA